MKSVVLFFVLMFAIVISKAQTVTYAEDIACIINTHCFNCHNNTNSLAAIPLTNYNDVWSHRLAIQYYVQNKIMPPYQPATHHTTFTHEKTLTQHEIDLIVAWVNQGSKEGDSALTPPAPELKPLKSKIVSPDISYQTPAYTVQNFVGFQYHCFVVPSTFNTDKKISQIEILPSNLSAIYSVFLYSDTSSLPLALDAADASNGYENYSGIGSPTAKLLYGWVNGNPMYHAPPNMALRLEANAHLVLRFLYSEDALNKKDSTMINIKFDSTATRIIDVATFLNHNTNLQNPPFIILADSMKTFYEQYTVPIDITLLSASHWSQKLCASMMCYAVTPTNDTIDILEIEDHEDIWSQGAYYFQKPIKIPAGSILYGEAEFNNTTSNYNNPFFPPQTITAGNGDTAEQMLFSFSYLPYQPNDENIVTDTIVHQLHYLNCSSKHSVGIKETIFENNFSVYPNPTNDLLNITSPDNKIFSVNIYNAIGVKVYSTTNIRNLQLNINNYPSGIYFIQSKINNQTFTKKIVKQ